MHVQDAPEHHPPHRLTFTEARIAMPWRSKRLMSALSLPHNTREGAVTYMHGTVTGGQQHCPP